jgi:hypothetical protein
LQAGKAQQRWTMTVENFLAPSPEPPIDEDEIREAVRELLFSRSHPALVRVVGKQVYHRCAAPPIGCTAPPPLRPPRGISMLSGPRGILQEKRSSSPVWPVTVLLWLHTSVVHCSVHLAAAFVHVSSLLPE